MPLISKAKAAITTTQFTPRLLSKSVHDLDELLFAATPSGTEVGAQRSQEWTFERPAGDAAAFDQERQMSLGMSLVDWMGGGGVGR